jgi:hypothetical protein
MPRKKVTISLDDTVPAEAATPAPKKPSAKATKSAKAPKSTVTEPVEAVAEAAETPKPRASRKKPVIVEPPVVELVAEAPKQKRAPRKKPVEVEVPAEPEVSVADPLIDSVAEIGFELVFRSATEAKAAEPKPSREVTPEPTAKPKRGRGRGEKSAPVASPVVALETEGEAVEDARETGSEVRVETPDPELSETMDGGLMVSFRSRSTETPTRSTEGRGDRRERTPKRSAPTETASAPSAPEAEVSKPSVLAESALESDVDAGFVFAFRAPSELPARKQGRSEDRKGDRNGDRNGDQGRDRGGDRHGRGRDRTGGRDDREEATVVAETVEVVAEVVPEPVAPPAPTWTQPLDGPQVVVRNGVPIIIRGHQIYPPLFFFGGATDERSANVIFDEARLASESGVHLHSYLLPFVVDEKEVEANAASAAFLLKRSVEIDPEAQVMFRVVFEAPRGWQDRFPNGRYRTLDGTPADPSVCDDDFWQVAENCLDRFVRSLRLLPEASHILGVHLERGEWFLAEGNGYDNSRAAEGKFRDWARTRYNRDEVSLRASWFDGSVRFDTISVPLYQAEVGEEDRFVRSSRKQRRVVDYHLFLSDATVDRISKLAHAVKVASEGYFMVGASYGYTFEWSHPASGHLALGKLLRTEEVDIIAGPPSYRDREPGGTASFPTPIDSFALNGKLYISEEDFKTSLGEGRDYDDFNPVLKTPQALESVHWRGTGVALSHATGLTWMDSWGQGWLKTHSVWHRAAQVLKALTERIAMPLGEPEVAVFIDERSLAYLVDQNAFALLVQNAREAILRAGVSAGFYLLSDLAHREQFPESKLYIFLNAWDIRPELRAAVKARLQRDNKVLFWLYSAGLFDGGRDSLERVREVTGIALKPQPFHSKTGTTLINRRHPLSNAFATSTITSASTLEPSYFAIPEEAVVLGEYSHTGLPSFVIKEHDEDPQARWTSVFLGEPVVTTSLIRSLAQLAGAHVWDFTEDVVHVRSPFLTVHTSTNGNRTIALPEKTSAYDLITGAWVANDSPNIRYSAVEGTTQSFLVGSRGEIEHLLQLDPTATLQITEIPERNSNVRKDVSAFDVPIMSLGDWMTGSESEEVSDEWFLRPAPVLEENMGQATESSERVGQRRRRGNRDRDRDRGGDRGGDRAPRATAEIFADKPLTDGDELAFMFRKKS